MHCPHCDYPTLPLSVPHPVICRPATRRGFITLFTALLSASVVLGLASVSEAAPCALPGADVAAIERTLDRLARPPALDSPSPWRRLGALLPRRLAWTSRDGISDGAGWYAGLSGGVSERALWGSSSGWSLRLIWDLRPLWLPTPQPAPSRWRDPLHRAEQLERLGARLATRLKTLARLARRALDPELDAAACRLLRQQARASLLVIAAALSAADQNWLREAGAAPTADRASRRRRTSAPPSRPVAGLPPLDPARPRSPNPGRAGSARSGGR